ncbi:MAG: response regulator transcription factor, partial [Motiliproteus sp.]|nr:response regulator transcription factor [Motiliproteus sp.]
MNELIAIVEDDPDQRQNYIDVISRRDYRVEAYGSRSEALDGFSKHRPDLVILDIMLGDDRDGGFHICQSLIQQYPELPIIFLTSRSDEIDQVFGLRLGAWDYQTKPVSLTILVERIAAMLKIAASRNNSEAAPSANGSLQLDCDRVVVKWKQYRIPLTVTECALLNVIVS